MSKIQSILIELEALNIELSVDDGRLRSDFSGSDLAESLRSRIEENEQELVQYLNGTDNNLNNKKIRSIPVTRGQERLWFLHKAFPESNAYVIPLKYSICGNVSFDLINTSLIQLKNTYPALAGSFSEDGSTFVVSNSNIDMGYIDHTGLPRHEHFAFCKEFYSQPFDLCAGPMFRAVLIRLASENHLLLLAIHHIVADGYSLNIIQESFKNIYEQVLIGGKVRQEPSDDGYCEWAEYQQSTEYIQSVQKDFFFWKKQFEGFAGLVKAKTPLGNKISSVNHCLESIQYELSAKTQRELIRFSRCNSIQQFSAWVAALAVLIYRLSGELDIVIGFAHMNRRANDRNIVGFLVNTLLLRVSIDSSKSYLELVVQVQESVELAVQHPNLYLDELVKELNISRSGIAKGNPIFSVMLNYPGFMLKEFSIDNTLFKPSLFEWSENKFDLEFSIQGHQSSSVSLSYDSARYSECHAKEILNSYCKLVERMPENSGKLIRDIGLVPSAFEEHIALKYTGCPVEYEDKKLLTDGFDSSVLNFPDHIAIEFYDEKLTYAELDSIVIQWQQLLLEKGQIQGQCVAIIANRSVEVVALIIATLRCGGFYLPLDPNQPVERTFYILQDANPAIIAVDMARSSVVNKNKDKALLIEKMIPEAHLERPLVNVADSNTPAYLIYTSGSTGEPKGVISTHANAINRIQWMNVEYGLGKTDVVLQKTPLTFDVSVWELFWPIMFGAKMVLAAQDAHRDPFLLKELIISSRITLIHFVPTLLQSFLNTVGFKEITTLRHVFCSGEILKPSVVEGFFNQNNNTQIHNLYGPTEAGIDVTFHECMPGEVEFGVPIGKPVSNTNVYILDSDYNTLPPGCVGEICISGVQVAAGYHNRADETAQKFVEDPIVIGRKMFCSGDLGWCNDNGEIYFVERKDFQRKFRGNRIELGEIESRLLEVDSISDCVVLIGSEVQGKEKLIAHIISREKDFNKIEVIQELSSWLPKYMVPSNYVLHEEFPLLLNGKLDKEKLFLHQNSNDFLRKNVHRNPLSHIQKSLIEIWENVLNVSGVHLDDNFFYLGGDSMACIEVVASAKEKGITLEVKDVYCALSLRQLSEIATYSVIPRVKEKAVDDKLKVYHPKTLTDDVEAMFITSSMLATLIYEGLTNKNYRIYTTSLNIKGEFNEELMTDSLNRVIQSHNFLRSFFHVGDDGEVVQLIKKNKFDAVVSVIDLTRLDSSEQKRKFNGWLNAEKSKVFQWDDAPLLRVTIHIISSKGFILTLSEPYLDGWSVSVVLSDLINHYDARLSNKIWQAPTHSFSYADFVDLEKNEENNKNIHKYFDRELSGAIPLILGKYQSEKSKNNGERASVKLERWQSDAMIEIAGYLGVSLKSVLLAVHLRVLALYTYDNDVLTGLMTNGRPEVKSSDRLVGMFLNTSPFRINITNLNWKELILKVHEIETQLIVFRKYPVKKLVLDGKFTKLFDILFNFTNFKNYKLVGEYNNIYIEGFKASDQTYYALTIQCGMDNFNRKARFEIEYDSTRISENFLSIFLGCYQNGFDSLLSDFGVENVPSNEELLVGPDMSIAESKQSVGQFSGNLITNFDQVVSEYPERIAVKSGEQITTYKDIGLEVDSIALELLQRGVILGSLIVICSNFDVKLVSAILSTLKLGAVYVPIDPQMPPGRVADILEIISPQLVICDSNTIHLFDCPDVLNLSEMVLRQESRCLTVLDDVDIAAIIFTSGSAGRPKGVLLSHKSLQNRLDWGRNNLAYSDLDVAAIKTSIGFVDSITEILGHVLYGTTCSIIENRFAASPEMLKEQLVQSGCTRLTIVPSILSAMLETSDYLSRLNELLSVCIVSGEPFSSNLAKRAKEVWPDVRLFNLYGSTEVTGDVTCYEVNNVLSEGILPIGRPIANTKIILVNKYFEVAPVGVIGELLVAGENLSVGYWKDQSPDSFVSLFDSNGEKSTFYRTGDFASINESGVLEYHGRKDRQLKIHGVRVELEEIEIRLCSHESITECAVVSGVESDVDLICYVVMRDDLANLSQVLASYLRGKLPRAYLPQMFIRVESLARTASGKIDYRKLSDSPVRLPNRPSNEHVSNEVHSEIVSIWKEVLGDVELNYGSSFFENGGNSLKAVQVVARLEDLYSIEIDVEWIFDQEELGKFADRLNEELELKKNS